MIFDQIDRTQMNTRLEGEIGLKNLICLHLFPNLELKKSIDKVAKTMSRIERMEKERSETIQKLTSEIEDSGAKQVMFPSYP